MSETVAILGASDHPSRFSHQAQVALVDAGHTPVPINPRLAEIDGVTCYPNLTVCPEPIDTVTVYVRAEILRGLVESIVQVAPKRVILNPGSEDRAVTAQLQEAGIRVEVACTLILLSGGRF